ncbi:hypothetical protein F511_28567 [Dorcoceras hygrometricum]|uniref:Uncharacterized protein n=1 Tax=Dorcoceras hygrometricum TaxID=472368 RepID=A0A2Z7A0U4_9LAMI|nr:hypothetical protein F511_28567 [Dorcoceras hygrometricum]
MAVPLFDGSDGEDAGVFEEEGFEFIEYEIERAISLPLVSAVESGDVNALRIALGTVQDFVGTE